MFKSIKASNLFSWEELDYEIKSGVSQIVGFNFDDNTSEGSGKSSIPNILSWVLYGKIPKEAKIDEVIREGCDSGSGYVELENGIKIFRSRKPNLLTIFTADDEIVQGKDAKETQTLITKIIGLDFDAFCQTVYFAQNYPKKFISSNETEKALILSEIQDLTIFDRAKKKAHDLIKMKEGEYLQLEKNLNDVRHNITRYYSNAELLVEFIDKFEESKKQKIDEIESNKETRTLYKLEYEKLLNSGSRKKELLESLTNTKGMLKDLADKKVEFLTKIKGSENRKRELEKIEREFSQVGKNIEFFMGKLKKYDSGGLRCPTCGGEVHDDKKNEVFSEKKEYENKLHECLSSRDFLISELSGLKNAEDISIIKNLLNEVEGENSVLERRKSIEERELFNLDEASIKLRSYNQEIEALESALEKIKKTEPTKELSNLQEIENKLETLKKQEVLIAAETQKKQREINNLNTLKDGFKEVKSYVFQSLLAELSYKATMLARDLFEVPVKVDFLNEGEDGGITKILTQVTLDGVTRSTGLLSGGQYRRVELSVDLALAGIVANRSQNPMNFRVLDEPMKDLSFESQEKVIKLLEQLDGSTIIIEHSPIIKGIIDNTFNICYRNGISLKNGD